MDPNRLARHRRKPHRPVLEAADIITTRMAPRRPRCRVGDDTIPILRGTAAALMENHRPAAIMKVVVVVTAVEIGEKKRSTSRSREVWRENQKGTAMVAVAAAVATRPRRREAAVPPIKTEEEAATILNIKLRRIPTQSEVAAAVTVEAEKPRKRNLQNIDIAMIIIINRIMLTNIHCCLQHRHPLRTTKHHLLSSITTINNKNPSRRPRKKTPNTTCHTVIKIMIMMMMSRPPTMIETINNRNYCNSSNS